MALTETTAPSVEPVTLTEVKDHILLTTTDHDTWLTTALTTARKYLFGLNGVVGRTLITTTYTLTLDGFPFSGVIYLPRPPVQSVTSIIYDDTDGDPVTWSSSLYLLDSKSFPGRITPAYNEDWPSTRPQNNNVRVLFKAGYGDAASDVAEDDKVQIMFLIAQWFRHREPTTERGEKAVMFALDDMITANREVGF